MRRATRSRHPHPDRHRSPLAPLLITLSVFGASVGCGRSDTVEPPVEARERAAVAVSVAEVQGRDEPLTLQASGSFQPQESSEVAPEAAGVVVATPVDVGQFVARGAILARLRGVESGLRLDEARAAAARAEANVKLAESQDALAQTTAQRYGALLASGDVSRTVADQAQTGAETSRQSVATARASLAEARAQLALAEKAVADVVVRAPFDGYVSARTVSLGEYVQPSTPVLTLLKIDPLRLQLTMPAVQAGQVSRGQTVRATVDAFPGQVFTGTMTAVNPAVAAESRSFIAEASVPNPEGRLKPGMFAVASIDQGKTQRVLTVPRSAVLEDVNTNSWRVFVIDKENRARLRVVQLAAQQQGDRTTLLQGVEEGERVATSRLGELYDTARVTISTGR